MPLQKTPPKKIPLRVARKNEGYNIHSILKYIQQLRNAEGHHLYMPEEDNVWNEAEAGGYTLPKYWQDYKQTLRNLKPTNAKDLLQFGASFGNPTGYILWKMPVRMHYHFNKLLDYASKILEEYGAEEPAVGVKIASGLSKIIYASKTKQGTHFTHGLTEALEGLEATKDPKVIAFAQKSREIFKKHLSKSSDKKMAV